MSNKINTFANVVMPSVVIVATVLLYFLFQPEESGTLFYVNLCYTLLLEGVFFGWLGLLRGGNGFSVAFRAAMGICAFFYVVAGIGWMLLYGILLSNVLALKWYIALIVVLTLIWLIVGSLLAQADSSSH